METSNARAANAVCLCVSIAGCRYIHIHDKEGNEKGVWAIVDDRGRFSVARPSQDPP